MQPLPNAPPTLMLADNDAVARAALQRVIAQKGLGRVVCAAENGPHTVDELLFLAPDIVLIDPATPQLWRQLYPLHRPPQPKAGGVRLSKRRGISAAKAAQPCGSCAGAFAGVALHGAAARA